MKTLVKKIIGYEFNELDEFAKENVKSILLECRREDSFFAEDLKYSLIDEYGLKGLDPYYELTYSQGDGLCLRGEITHSELFDNPKFNYIAFKGIHHKQVESIKNDLDKITFEHKSRYFHANSVNIDCEVGDYNITEKQEAIIEKIEKNVKEWYFQFCKEWENYGYKYFYEISDEEAVELCEMYEFLFTEDGEIIDRILYVECKCECKCA